MNAATEFDLGPLTWVKGEIDAALDRANEALAQFRASNDTTKLTFCRTHVHQVHGALAIVGLDGVTQVTEALEGVLSALADGKASASTETLAVIEKTLAAIRHYLDDLMVGEPNQPLKLLPVYKSLSGLNGASRLRSSDLFFPDLSVRPPKRSAPVARLSPDEFRACLKSERMRFQKGLLAWLRNPAGSPLAAGGLEQMGQALKAIEATQDTPAARSFWWISQGFLDTLGDRGIAAEQDAKQLCARIDLQIRRLLEGSRNVAERLMRDALYFVGQAPGEASGLAAQVSKSFQLESLIPKPESSTTTAPQEAALRRLREVIVATEEFWNKFCGGSAGALTGFVDQARNCAQIGATIGHADLKRLAEGLATIAVWLAEQPSRQSDSAAMEVATAILLLQNAQENFKRLGPDFSRQVDLMVARLKACIAGTGSVSDPGVPLLDEITRRAQEKLLIAQVAREIQNNLAQIEQSLDAFFREPQNGFDAAALSGPLKQIGGALMILGHEKAVALLDDCSKEIARFGVANYKPSEENFVAVAQQLSTLGFFIEALQTGTTDYDEFIRRLSHDHGAQSDEEAPDDVALSVEEELEHKKENTQALLAAFKEAPEDEQIKKELKQNLQALSADADLLADQALGETAKAALSALEAGGISAATEIEALNTLKGGNADAPTPSAETLKLAQASHEEIDAELLEIFLEEAHEVLGAIENELAQLREQPHNVDTLTNLRRAAHTLKGSGRMVGLKDLGEVAWEVEQTLNMWLRQEMDVSPALMDMIGLAHNVFQVWVGELERRTGSAPDVTHLVAQAQSLRGAEPAETKPAAVAPAKTPAPDPDFAATFVGSFGQEEPEPAAPAEPSFDIEFSLDEAAVVVSMPVPTPKVVPANKTAAEDEFDDSLFSKTVIAPELPDGWDGEPTAAPAPPPVAEPTFDFEFSVEELAVPKAAAPTPAPAAPPPPASTPAIALVDTADSDDLMTKTVVLPEAPSAKVNKEDEDFDSFDMSKTVILAEVPGDHHQASEPELEIEMSFDTGITFESAAEPDPITTPLSAFKQDEALAAVPVDSPTIDFAVAFDAPAPAPLAPPPAAPVTQAYPEEELIAFVPSQPANEVLAPAGEVSINFDEPAPVAFDEAAKVETQEAAIEAPPLGDDFSFDMVLGDDVPFVESAPLVPEAPAAPTVLAVEQAPAPSIVVEPALQAPVAPLIEPVNLAAVPLATSVLTSAPVAETPLPGSATLVPEEVADNSFVDVFDLPPEAPEAADDTFVTTLVEPVNLATEPPVPAPLVEMPVEPAPEPMVANFAPTTAEEAFVTTLVEPVDLAAVSTSAPLAETPLPLAPEEVADDSFVDVFDLPPATPDAAGDAFVTTFVEPVDLDAAPLATPVPTSAPVAETPLPGSAPPVPEDVADDSFVDVFDLPPATPDAAGDAFVTTFVEPVDLDAAPLATPVPTSAPVAETPLPGSAPPVPEDVADDSFVDVFDLPPAAPEVAGDAFVTPLIEPVDLAAAPYFETPVEEPAPEPMVANVEPTTAEEFTAEFSGALEDALALPVEEPAPSVSEEIVDETDALISPALFEIFREEARGHLDTLHKTYGELEANPKMPTAFAMTRAAHTLGGIAATVGLMPINKLAIGLEHALLRRDNSVQLDSIEGVETVRQTILALEDMFIGLESQIAPVLPGVLLDALGEIFPLSAPSLEGVDALPPTASVPLATDVSPVALDAQIETVAMVAARIQETPRLQDELDEQLLPIFLEEAQDIVRGFAEQLREWRQTPGAAEAPRALARLLHTFKGGARMAGAMNLGEMTHTLETSLEDALRSGQLSLPLLEHIENGCDALTQVVEQLVTGGAPTLPEAITLDASPPIETEAPTLSSESDVEATASTAAANLTTPVTAHDAEAADRRSMIRVRADMVDRLVNEAGELSITRARIEGEMRSLKTSMLDLTENVIRLRRQLREIEIQAESQIQAHAAQTQEGKAEFDPLELDRFSRFQEVTRFMAESVNDVATVQQSLLKNLDDANAALIAQARMNRALQQNLMGIRMVPFASQSERLYRIVRQTGKDLGRRANLDIRGGHVELDRSVLDKMMAPIEHMLRNAISHGVEDREARLAAGKSEIGEVALSLAQEGNEIVVTMSDDGRGLDAGKIRARAESLGLLAPGEDADDRRLFDFIFQAGFSTATEVTQVSGRGVGMDVVRSEVASLGGRIDISSVFGQGTTFRLYLPLTLAVTQTLLVLAAGTYYAIPSTMIEQVLEVKEAGLAEIRQRGEAQWMGNHYPFYFLPHMLGDSKSVPEERRRYWVLLLRSGARRVAVHVDELAGNQEVVVKNIGAQLARVAGIAGATVLGDGRVVLILNPVTLASRQQVSAPSIGTETEAAARVAVAEAPAAPSQQASLRAATMPTVMVVDDSLTVRKITGRLLAREGYQVVTAKDGVDALEQLIDFIPDIMLSDIEMPRMDGFDLVRNVRADPRLLQLPIIMITSRTADKHRNYALEIGANEYLGKPFDEETLLGLITEYLKK